MATAQDVFADPPTDAWDGVAEFLEKYQLDVLFVGREVLDELRGEEETND